MRNVLIISCVAAMASLGAATTQAAEWLIDFGTEAADPTNGGTWNVIGVEGDAGIDSPVSGVTVLADSTGSTAANVQLNITDDIFDNHKTQAGPTQDAAWVGTTSVDDYLILTSTTNPTSEFVFQNLSSDQTYTIELAATRQGTGTKWFDADVNGSDPDNFATGASGTFNSGGNTTVVIWSGLTPVSGKLTMSLDVASGSEYPVINALRLTSVPEPASLALLGVGGALMVGRRRW